MVNFEKPNVPRHLSFTVITLFCHCIGYHIFRAIVLNGSGVIFKLPAGDIRHIIYVFTVVEIMSLLIVPIVIELFVNKHFFIFTITLIWTFIFGIFHGSISIFPVILFGFISSLLKVAVLSYGASEYVSPKYSPKLYEYFLFTHLTVVLSKMASIYFVPPNVPGDSTSMSFGMTFMTSRLMITTIFGIVCTFVFGLSKFSFRHPNLSRNIDVRPIFVTGKIINVIFIVAPFLVGRLAQTQILRTWPEQVMLTSPDIFSYMFDRNYAEFIYLSSIAVFIVIFYVLFFNRYAKRLTSSPSGTIVIGCVLMLIASITTRKLEVNVDLCNHADTYVNYTKGNIFCTNYRYIMSVEREKSGLPLICFTCEIAPYSHMILMYKLNRVDENLATGLRYSFMCNYSKFPCQNVLSGIYRMRDYLRTSSNSSVAYHLETGASYIVNIATEYDAYDFTVVTLIPPLEISLFWLLLPMIMMAVGATLIDVTGLFIMYTKSRPKLKTASIGLWMFSSRFGDLVKAVFNHRTEKFDSLLVFKILAILIVCSGVICICLAMFAFSCFKKKLETNARMLMYASMRRVPIKPNDLIQ